MVNAANGAEVGERLDSPKKIDWNAVRTAAKDCLHALLDLDSWAVRSQDDDYDTDESAQHLAAIEKAKDVFWQAFAVYGSAGNTVFDQLNQASVCEGTRPDFGFAATAHETTFVLLALIIQRIQHGAGDASVRLRVRDNYDVVIEDLHSYSPKQLRDILHCSEKIMPLQRLFDCTQSLTSLYALIDREWAAVTSSASTEINGTGRRAPNQTTYEQKVERILDRMRLHARTRGETKRRHYQYLNEKKNDPEWIKPYEEASTKFKHETFVEKSEFKS
jgi:hypothetical protein